MYLMRDLCTTGIRLPHYIMHHILSRIRDYYMLRMRRCTPSLLLEVNGWKDEEQFVHISVSNEALHISRTPMFEGGWTHWAMMGLPLPR